VCILIIEDDQEDQQIMKEAFDMITSPTGSIHFVDDGHSALQFLSTCNDTTELPRLIVLDINMPKISGVETLKVIKENALLRQIPVIMFSSSFNPSDIQATREEGVVDYITKPNTFAEYKGIAEKFASYCGV